MIVPKRVHEALLWNEWWWKLVMEPCKWQMTHSKAHARGEGWNDSKFVSNANTQPCKVCVSCQHSTFLWDNEIHPSTLQWTVCRTVQRQHDCRGEGFNHCSLPDCSMNLPLKAGELTWQFASSVWGLASMCKRLQVVWNLEQMMMCTAAQNLGRHSINQMLGPVWRNVPVAFVCICCSWQSKIPS